MQMPATRARGKEATMKEHDINELGAQEQVMLDRSFQPALSDKRVRNVLLSTGMTIAGVALFAIYGASIVAITAIALVIVAVSAAEKVSYARELLAYKSLVRSLVYKLEKAQGIEPTPLEGHPAARASRQARAEEKLARASG
jgi:hypothetical protein